MIDDKAYLGYAVIVKLHENACSTSAAERHGFCTLSALYDLFRRMKRGFGIEDEAEVV